MTADVHVRIDVSSLLCAGAAAAALYGAVRYLQWRQWPSATRPSSDQPRSSRDAAAALTAQLLQLHYPPGSVPAPETDVDGPAALQAISCVHIMNHLRKIPAVLPALRRLWACRRRCMPACANSQRAAVHADTSLQQM